MPQDDIGFELGLIVPKKYMKLLPRAKTGKRPLAGWGTQINIPKYYVNGFFRKYNYPLKEERFPASKIPNAKKWIADQFRQGNDIFVLFNYGKLYGRGDHGHASILESVSGDKATLIDPGEDVPKFRTVKLKDLLAAMVYHERGGTGGFRVIGSAKKT